MHSAHFISSWRNSALLENIFVPNCILLYVETIWRLKPFGYCTVAKNPDNAYDMTHNF
jgi:hypothetical protein